MKKTTLALAITLLCGINFSISNIATAKEINDVDPEVLQSVQEHRMSQNKKVVRKNTSKKVKVLPSGVVETEEIISNNKNDSSYSSSLSGLQIETDRDVLKDAEYRKYLKGAVTQLGQPLNPGKPLEGFAKNLSLVEVLKQVLPVGWKATTVKSINVNQEVSWYGGKNWVETVEDLADNYTLNVLIDWDNKTLRLLSTDKLVALNKSREKITNIDFSTTNNTVNTANTVSEREKIVLTSSNNSNNIVKNARPADLPGFGVVGTWYVKEGNLRDNLEELLRLNNIKLVYPDIVANYPIEDSFVLQGVLEGENGVLAQIAELFNYESVKQPLDFEFKTGSLNKVLEVKNATYQQRYFLENN